jgi:bifunctional UDP-N-acetylglucosamine pyrophosphorylase/glucosamine-1-phosphate N-acetyltransferase
MRNRLLRIHMLAGVTITDPATTYIDAGVVIEPDVMILPGSSLRGATRVATGTTIGPGSTLEDAIIGPDSRIQSSVVEQSAIGARVTMGPFAHARGGAEIGDDCELGNYAEVKNSRIGRGVKMHHFSYCGDADVGDGANLAAGMITCNFDGEAKHRTVIGAGAFIGCDTMLVAPVTIGEGAYTATGAVVTHDVAPGMTVAGVPAREFTRRVRKE